ncbi:methyl-CpG-binding domain-containing protein 7 isoform X2 [Populus alba]|uniref:Methyl-CpG-binding domain-containing protein 7-like isoform X1 n=1 Tax=Populus alba TaxID=43335 RepID=A0A4U5QFI7_POPAL|nr:methyl-CpG-binding domain-containing protein 7 isoform X2 [Populus alba]TKS09294.1 methyl-CpG-binding domain-containing protein 7-like isoform X1 [Populus alba]
MDAKISSQNQNNELQVSTTIYHQFKLPNDWVVVRRCRSKRGNRRSHNDKYHYEPGTGQRFCSMISTQKHLSGETSKSAKPGNKKNIQIDPYIFKSCSLFDLPNGWIVEKKPRKNMECAGIIDKHYFEPETGKRSRSLRSVEKYLTEGKEHIATLEALKAGDNFIPSKSSSSQKEHVSRKKVETSMLDPSSIPAKIKWVLSGPGGIVWNPFMDDSLVPEFIKQKWSETFVFSIIDRL